MRPVEAQPLPDTFTKNLRDAFGQIILSPQQANLLMAFKEAYEYRAQFRWLGESGHLFGKHNPDGVTYALRAVLESYVVKHRDLPLIDSRPEELQIKRHKTIDPEWKEKLFVSLDDALNETVQVQIFAREITRDRRATPNTLTPDAIRKHLIKALDQYVKHSRKNTSSDPW